MIHIIYFPVILLFGDDNIPPKDLSKKELNELILNDNCVFDENFQGMFFNYLINKILKSTHIHNGA